ncbi:peptidoglycan DD-metalloendopeptidase family protein [Vibrio salinus]|uniref:peptidoglycan DD-metalloendopeptidase family protein n=1 Tax=Vibrio salinus TaxID=2899784 RepID=UPI001E43BBE4|nr:peptidoglycan DD-metalloendopeptidase family protein [Vibrio salinus]MCE0493128.1 peptidoglycan DD-metalloendopeptidase family protein [Vibrio salinus]
MTDKYFPIFGNAHPKEHWVPIDLSESNPNLNFDRTCEPDYLDNFVCSHFNESCTVAIGGYREKRATYRNASHFSALPASEVRDRHLGIDLWVAAGTPVYAPLEGVVHSFAFNDLPFDYGPTIILKHTVDDNEFYSLYGHLSLDSLEGLQEGQVIFRGQEFARIGDRTVNGGWPPHLHIQVIRDMYGLKGDFYGAASEKEQVKLFSNCPDPSFLLGL